MTGSPTTVFKTQWALNQFVVLVLVHRASRVDKGRITRKPRKHRTACAVRVISCAPSCKIDEVEGKEVFEDALETVEEVGVGDSVSGTSRDLVRFRVKGPASRCCSRSADEDELDGMVIPKAQTSCCIASLFFGILKAKIGVVGED